MQSFLRLITYQISLIKYSRHEESQEYSYTPNLWCFFFLDGLYKFSIKTRLREKLYSASSLHLQNLRGMRTLAKQ